MKIYSTTQNEYKIYPAFKNDPTLIDRLISEIAP